MQKKIDLVNGPVLSSLTRLAIPIMATSLIQMAYNMTDMIWIGRIGSSAVASVGAAGMYMWLSNGLAALARMGGQVNVGHALGSSDRELASDYAAQSLILTLFLGLVYGSICILAAKPLIHFFHLNQLQVIQDAIHYLQKPDFPILASIIKIGLPTSIQSMLFTGISMIIARLVAGYGDAAVAVQKVGSQIESISWMTADGFAAAVNSFTSQNHGAGKKGRIYHGYTSALKVVFVWGIFCTLLLIFCPAPIFRIFIAEEKVLPLGLNGIWWSITVSSILKGILLFIWFLVFMHREKILPS